MTCDVKDDIGDTVFFFYTIDGNTGTVVTECVIRNCCHWLCYAEAAVTDCVMQELLSLCHAGTVVTDLVMQKLLSLTASCRC